MSLNNDIYININNELNEMNKNINIISTYNYMFKIKEIEKNQIYLKIKEQLNDLNNNINKIEKMINK